MSSLRETRSPSAPRPATLVELLREKAASQPDRRVFTFLTDGEGEETHLTYGELDRQARAVAARLRETGVAAGERALLLYPAGLEYISAFFGCQYAGVVAVPAYPARLNKPAPRIEAIVGDAQAAVALTTSASLKLQEGRMGHTPSLEKLNWLATDEVNPEIADQWTAPEVSAESLAFLQYTSGSTGTPRGVMVSHGNIMHNADVTMKRLGSTPDVVGVFWLPFYHDMGLIGAILQPLYCGGSSVLMAPVHFLQRPVRWLKAVSQYRAAATAAPNFAYDLCVRKVTPEQRADLDLSSLRVALNGAEPVRPETMDRFAETFSACGFRREAFYPCYGLAEATLFVTGGMPEAQPVVRPFRAADLEQNQAVAAMADEAGARLMVGCGQGAEELKVVIVNPESSTECAAGQVGEVWVSGPSIAKGYWNRPEESAQTFGARLGDGPETYLRTGDLGFLQDGELFVTGRLKDLIIIRGSNHYPQDIERTAEASHAALQPNCAAAFSVDVDGEEQLVVVAEVERQKRDADVEEVTAAVRQALAENHELTVHAVWLLKPGALPRTSSGKVQRHACKLGYMNNTLETVGRWSRTDEQTTDAKPEAAKPAPTAQAIQAWLVGQLAQRLGVKPQDVNVREPFARYGLDSAAMVEISGELETWLDRRLSPSLGWEYPTIELLSKYLAEAPATVAATANEHLEPEGEPIAIIGMSCRFPGSPSPEGLWKLVSNGIDAVTEVPKERWNANAFYDPNPAAPGKVVTRWGGFVDGVDQFDAAFFDISPREASRMDPQQRLLLETAWEALEDAGQVPERLGGQSIGVYVGIFDADYARVHISDPRVVDAYGGTGNAYSIAANRLSYFFGFRGPSLAVDTACSSALVAMHLACQSLQNGESKMAVVGGVNVLVGPYVTMTLSKGGFMSPDGRCKSFGDRGNGYVRSDGVGVVVLKPLSQALADGDPIHAVIRGSAVNNDGRSNGLTAPSRQAQEQLIRDALRRAGVAPAMIDYVEAHGTGTSMGDLIEALALGTVLGVGRTPGEKMPIGSIKSNIGHTEPAAGMASMIKLVQALKHRQVPPSLHSKELNTNIPWDELPLVVQQELGPMTAKSGRSIGGVSAFGFGGTNAHFIVEEAPRLPAPETVEESDKVRMLPLSARATGALKALARSYYDLLGNEDGPALGDVCFSAALRRDHHSFRKGFVGRSKEELREKLAKFMDSDEELSPSVRKGADGRPKVVYVFAGQGPQFWGMARQLMEKAPVFRAKMQECDALLRPLSGWSLLDELNAEESASRLDETRVAQPVLFAMQVSLAEMWKSMGVPPDAVVGHSMGEVAAAHVSGALTLEDAVKVIYHRSRLMQRATGHGGMVALEMQPEEVEQVAANYPRRLSLAAANGPTSFVLAGDPDALEEVVETQKQRGVFSKWLTKSYAFHSPHMEPLQAELVEALKDIRPQPTTVPIVSTVTGREAEGTEFDAAYWGRQVREPVHFSTAIGELADMGHELYVEMGPHPVLCRSVTECVRDRGREVTAVPTLKRREDDQTVVMEALAALYGRGYPIEWSRHTPAGRCVKLPTYPWQHQRHWFDEKPSSTSAAGWGRTGPGGHPLLSGHMRSANATGGSYWETEVDRLTPPWVDDHRVQGATVVPGTSYVEMALAAGQETFGKKTEDGAAQTTPSVLSDVAFHQMVVLPQGVSRRLQVGLTPKGKGEWAFEVHSRPAGEETDAAWTLHATGRVAAAPPATEETPAVSLEEIIARCTLEIPAEYFFAALKERGLIYGPCFQSVQRVWRRDGEALGELVVPEAIAHGSDGYHLHPAVLDAALQVLAPAVSIDAEGGPSYIPVAMGKVKVHGKLPRKLYSHATLRPGSVVGEPTLEGDLRLLDESGKALVEIEGLKVQQLGSDQGAMPTNTDDWLYEIKWEQRALAAGKPMDQAGNWILFADGNVTPKVRAVLAAQGESCVVVWAGDHFESIGEGTYTINPSRPEDYRRLFDEVRTADGPACRGIVHMWGLRTPAGEATVASLDEAQRLGCIGVMHLVQALAEVGLKGVPRFYMVTRNAQAVADESVPGFAQSPLWGLARVLSHEQPHLRVSAIDLSTDVEAEALATELLAGDREDLVALRGADRYTARLARFVRPEGGADEPRPLADGEHYRLEVYPPGSIDNLRLRSAPMPAAGPDEVVIEVMAAGLNFRDVLRTLGLYPGLPEGSIPLGDECSGRIVAVGEDVKGFPIGLEVVAIAGSSFGRYAVARAALVAAKPENLTFEEAATVPITFSTAYHALVQLARLHRREKVLIHAAAGGVGLAAIQIAQAIGSEIFATCSTEKRAYVESLGVKHVMDSRTLAFADEIMARTNGKGVDVVLNSLAGEFIPKSFSVLASHGRFLEIGKRDIYQDGQLEMKYFQKCLTFAAIDLERLCREKPDFVTALLEEVMANFEKGVYRPLPHQVVSITEAGEAFRRMAQAKHIGKIVLSLQERPTEVSPPVEKPMPIRADGTYLVTGGLGGLGLKVVRWLTDEGARYIVITGRSAPNAEAAEELDSLRADGVRILVVRGDVSKEEDVVRILAEIDRTMPPLRGVIHSAGVLEEGVVLKQTEERFRKVLAPKVAGTWNLHARTLDRPLDFFVVFSSMAAVFGSPGQGNYAAANAFLDGLMKHRRAMGLPGSSINWGAWAEVGMAARMAKKDRKAHSGLGDISVEKGLKVLGELLRDDPVMVGVVPVNWPLWLGSFPVLAEEPLLCDLAKQEVKAAGGEAAKSKGSPVRDEIVAAAAEDRPAKLEAYLQKEVARVLGLPAEKVALNQPLTGVGLDSLMVIELKNRIESGLGVELQMMGLLQGPSIKQWAGEMLPKLVEAAGDAAPAQPVAAGDQEPMAGLDQLPAGAAEELLTKVAAE